MPRQRTHHRRMPYVLSDEFHRSLERFKEASGLSWAELARRLGTSDLTVRRWRAGIDPNAHHLLALQDLAESMGLGHLLPRARVQRIAVGRGGTSLD